ncbi:glycosyltransferase [bacterium]|nr:glycosyltransferase [bacterium]
MPNPNGGLHARRRVAFCVRDMQVGGVEIAMLRTIDALRARGDVDVAVITYVPIRVERFQKWFAARPDIQIYTLYPCAWLGTRLVRFFPVRLIQHWARDLYRAMRRRRLRPDQFGHVDVFVDYYNFQFVSEFRHLHGAKVAWWHSSIDVLWRQKAARHVGDYDRFVMLTDEGAAEFKAHMPHDAKRVRRIYNPVDVHEIQGLAATGDRAPGDYFCAVSRLAGDKDVQTILTAFDLFWRQNARPNVQLIIVGDGHLRDALQAYAGTLAARDHIVFTGRLTNPYGYMRGARAHILSSHGEGLPTVLVEAAATGTPNIASECKNGPREILLDGDAGLLYTPGDAVGLAQCMADIWAGRADARAMTGCATRGLRRFDAMEIADQIMRMMDEIC